MVEDISIVDLYLKRREEAIARTSEKYGSRLRTISVGIVRDQQSAEECENDTYLQAWNRIPPSKPYTYLFAFLARIVRHISLDLCRKRDALKRDARLVELTQEMEQCIPSGGDPQLQLDHKLLAEQINRYLRTLPADKRNIFMRRYWYMDSVSDIARMLDMSQSRVKVTLYRCREALRRFLEKEGYCV